MTLDPSLWGDAREAQEQRRVADPWEDILAIFRIPWFTSRAMALSALPAPTCYPCTAYSNGSTNLCPWAAARPCHGARRVEAQFIGNVTINGKPVRGYIRTAYESSVGQHKGTKVNRVPFDVAKRTCEAAMKKCQPRPSYPSP